ncbi:hypothetical protein L1987_12495 [Smallanthus sonchifolius]|uniref:Uncharacterized protein n=1 Tax=Smallanthus sonchifolius TaxID=185202 RepID=A0ACB9JG12_9ASTR|nr:hypothetical protein L1987_12495 [Smallanthus sonchifolius]
MTEKFQISELLFPEKKTSGNGKEIRYPKVQKRKTDPVNIREEFSGSSWVREYLQTHSFEEEEEIVPPHVILARRMAGKAAFSLCSGNGRTLKGRDLSEVRNSILRLTGFIES